MTSTDATGEFSQVLTAWEMKTPEERTENKIIDDVLIDWLGKEFAKEVKIHTQAKTKSLQWCQREAYFNQQFARAAEILSEDWDTVGEERKKQIQKGFLIKKHQIEEIIGKDAMVGWVSNLTFINLLDDADPEDHLKLVDCFAKPYDDARNGIDFMMEAQEDGGVAVNLIQLKSNGKGKASIERFDEQSLEEQGVWVGSRLIDAAVSQRFLEKRAEIAKRAQVMGTKVVVKCFVVEVPSFDNPEVEIDPFGRVKSEGIRAQFVQECHTAGLIERKKI